MTKTYPGIVPSGYNGDYSDFLKVKNDRSGAVRLVSGVIAVPNTTASATNVGLFPFETGCRVHAIKLWTDQLDTSTNVTVSVGSLYEDSTLTGTSNSQAFINSSTAPQTSGGANVSSNNANSAGNQFIASQNGWVVAQIGHTTTSSGNLSFSALISYDTGGVTV